MKKLLLTVAIFSLTGLSQPAFAHGDEDHGDQPHETTAEASMPATTTQEALTSIQTSMDVLGSQIDAGQLDLTHAEIEKIDAEAFVVMHSIRDTRGGMIKKRAFKH